MKHLIFLILLPLLAAAQEPPWLTALRAAKQAQPQHVDRVVVLQPADSKAGYWTVTHERVPAETRMVPVRSIDPEAEVPEERLITTPERIIHRWAWVEEHAPYQGNTASLIFHQEGCRYWDCRDCTQYFTTIEEALEQGFRPCGICKPGSTSSAQGEEAAE